MNIDLRPYANDPWFINFSKEQQIVYETRVGMCCADRPVTDWAHETAYREAMELDQGKLI